MTSASTLPGPAERLREAAADRLPARLRAPVPWRAVALALVLAAVVAAVAFARASASPSATASAPLPPRAAAHPRTAVVSWGSPSDASAGPASAQPVRSRDAGAAAVPTSPAGVLVVDVAGRVARPGLVRVPPGSRVWDAVVAAGGPSPQARLERLNLARPLQDGEQVFVPGATDPVAAVGGALPAGAAAGAAAGSGAGGPPGAGGGAGGGASGAADGRGPLDLNAATADQLDTLPGVGPVLAGRIVSWREQHGRFTRVEELGEVPGIGPKLLSQLRPLVRVA